MKYLLAIMLLCVGCSSRHYVREINVPAHKLIICDFDTLNELYPQYLKDGRLLFGCADMGNNVIWCTPQFFNHKMPDTDIYWHEVRHLTEGYWHK